MSDAGAERVLVCRSGDERFALPVTLVREVVALPQLTRIPGAPSAVRGLANVHGILVTVLGGSPLPGSPSPSPSAAGSGDWLVVLASRDGQLGLAVDEVEALAVRSEAAVPLVEVQAFVQTVMGG